MKKRIMFALLVSLASLGICTDANAMEKGKKAEPGISNEISRDKNIGPTWNGKPISQELRLVYMTSVNGSESMTKCKEYWNGKVEESNYLDGRPEIKNTFSYVLLVDSQDNVVGLCYYRPLEDIDKNALDKLRIVLNKDQIKHAKYCCGVEITKRLRGVGIGLSTLRAAIEKESEKFPETIWCLDDFSSASEKMGHSVYCKLGFKRPLVKNKLGVCSYIDDDLGLPDWHGWMIRYPKTTDVEERVGRHPTFNIPAKQKTMFETSIKRFESFASENLEEKLIQKKYKKKMTKQKRQQYKERKIMKDEAFYYNKWTKKIPSSIVKLQYNKQNFN